MFPLSSFSPDYVFPLVFGRIMSVFVLSVIRTLMFSCSHFPLSSMRCFSGISCSCLYLFLSVDSCLLCSSSQSDHFSFFVFCLFVYCFFSLGFLFAFSYSHASFDNIKTKWMPEIQHHCTLVRSFMSERIDFVMRLMRYSISKRRRSPTHKADGEVVAMSIDAYAYRECSALTRRGLKEVFDTAIVAVVSQPSGGCCTIL